MNKGEIYIACSFLSAGLAMYCAASAGLGCFTSAILGIIPAAAFLYMAVKWTDKFTTDEADRIIKKMKNRD